MEEKREEEHTLNGALVGDGEGEFVCLFAIGEFISVCHEACAIFQPVQAIKGIYFVFVCHHGVDVLSICEVEEEGDEDGDDG